MKDKQDRMNQEASFHSGSTVQDHQQVQGGAS
jgi:hypothetical protein